MALAFTSGPVALPPVRLIGWLALYCFSALSTDLEKS
jgi:hypothetical protein